jgi:hypothetical protein
MKQIKAKEYLEELAQQVREKKQQKQREKDESDRLDRQHEVDNANFNPYGRSGCGAPLKNRGGDTMANLRQADPFQYSSSTTDNGNNFYSGHNATSASSHQTSGGANASVSHQGEPFFPRGSSKGAFGSSDDKVYKEASSRNRKILKILKIFFFFALLHRQMRRKNKTKSTKRNFANRSRAISAKSNSTRSSCVWKTSET